MVVAGPQAPQRSPHPAGALSKTPTSTATLVARNGVLYIGNDCVEARGFWTMLDLEDYITFKELKAVRCAIKAFVPELKANRQGFMRTTSP